MGDDERATIGARHRAATPRGGVPAVEIHDESTLPPQPIPEMPRAIAGINDRSTRDALELQGKAIEGLTEAMGKVWDARHDKERFERLEHGLDEFSKRVDKLIDTIIGTSESVNKWLIPSMSRVEKRVDDLADDIPPRLAELEKAQFAHGLKIDHFGLQVSAISSQFQGVQAQGNALESRLVKAEGAVDSLLERVDEGERTDESHTTRLVALEKRNNDADIATKTNKWWIRSIVGAAAVVAGFVGSHLHDIATWLGGH